LTESSSASAPAIAGPPAARFRVGRVFALAVGAAVVIAALRAWNAGRHQASRPTAPGAIRSLAVLPLQNLSRGPEQEFVAGGMTEELITALAQIRPLRVISRTSAMGYKGTTKPVPQIGRELGVDGILEGSVQRAGNRVRITAQLIEAASDRHIWAKSNE